MRKVTAQLDGIAAGWRQTAPSVPREALTFFIVTVTLLHSITAWYSSHAGTVRIY